MAKVASDPVALRPSRSESTPARPGARAAKPKDAFETLLDTPEARPPHAERPERTGRAERPGRSRSERTERAGPADDRSPATGARGPRDDAERPEAAAEPDKPSPDTPQAKSGQPSETIAPETSEDAVVPDATAQAAEEFSVLAEAVVIPDGETRPVETIEIAVAPEKVDDSGETDATAAPVAPAPDVPAPVAAALPSIAPTNPLPVAATGDADVAPVGLDAVSPTPPTDVAAPEAPAPQAPAPPATADTAPVDTAPVAIAPAKSASNPAKAETTPQPTPETRKPTALAAAVVTETPAPESVAPEQHKPADAGPAETSEDTGKTDTGKTDIGKAAASKGETSMREQHGAVRPGSDHHASLEPARIPADAPAKEPIKPVPHVPAAERPLALQSASAEARHESAPAPLNLGAVGNTAPVVPFHLAAQPILPTTSPLTALRVETGAGPAVPIAGLAVEIVARSQDGAKRFEIRLDPPELGRIDVRLDVDQTGKVSSRLVVERAETLDLLRRDAPQLERALQHAGLNTEGGLEFSLRDQSFANRDQPRDGNVSRLIIPEDEPAAAEAARRGYGRMIGLGGGVDIRV